MTYFSRKNSYILLALSVILLFASTVLILFSNQFVSVVYSILSQKIFHREFSLDKWMSSINSIFMIPIFCTIVFSTIIFIKHPLKQKIIFLFILLADVFFAIMYVNYVSTPLHIDTDLASEVWLGKECVREHTFWPTGWFYSTEFRLLNTQIFSAIGFLFSSDWNLVKTIQSILSCLLLFWATWYLLKQLHIKSTWIILFACIIAISPWSGAWWTVGAGENFYIPHVVISFLYIATFINLIYADTSAIQKKKLLILFFALAFISGLSTIRYILLFTFPLALSAIIIEVRNKQYAILSKEFWLHNSSVFYSTIALFISGFGYICNSFILRHIWSFSSWNTLGFNYPGDVTFSDILLGNSGILALLGYKPGVAIFTPSGIINILSYIAVIQLSINIVSFLKQSVSKSLYLFLVFFLVATGFNTFIFLHTEYAPRFYYPLLIYIVPTLAILLDGKELPDTNKFFLGITWSILLLTATFATLQSTVSNNTNSDKEKVLSFLLENDYDFGYSTTKYSTIFTFLSNGKIEVGNLAKEKTEYSEAGNHYYISKSYKYDPFLTPKHIYSDENHKDKKIFFLVSQDQYAISPDLKIWESGRLVYEDEWYRVYDYENHAAFKNGF